MTSIYGRGGGALLGDRWILTAAHTIYPKNSIFLGKSRRAEVFLGHTNIDELLELGGHPVRRVVVHPDYRPDQTHNFHGDIALLELRHSVPLGPHLLPVCLPDRKALYRPGLAGYVSGFGVENGWLTTELKYSQVPVAPRAACEAWLREKRRTEVFSGGMFCAGDSTRPQSVCQGDSGGAYVVWDDRARRWVATGIVSWGIGCGEGYTPVLQGKKGHYLITTMWRKKSRFPIWPPLTFEGLELLLTAGLGRGVSFSIPRGLH